MIIGAIYRMILNDLKMVQGKTRYPISLPLSVLDVKRLLKIFLQECNEELSDNDLSLSGL
jgi:hypothetical protein